MPKSRGKNEEMKEISRSKIMEAGLRLFSHKGLAATSTADIAELAGVSAGLMYYYYQSKEDLYAELIRTAIREANTTFRNVSDMPVTPLEKIWLITENVLADLNKNDQISQYFILMTQAMLNVGPKEKMQDYMEDVYVTYNIMKEIIMDGQHSGEIRKDDPKMLTTLYLSSINGICTYKLIMGEQFVLPGPENIIVSLLPDDKEVENKPGKPVPAKKKIVVIGAGVSGLVAGIYALKAGFDAEIYESHNVAGGECTGWRRNGYAVDGCIHWLTGTQKGTDLYKIWETCHALGEDVAVLNSEYITAYRHHDETYYFYTDLEKLEREFLKISPEDVAEIRNFMEIIGNFRELAVPAHKPDELLSEEERNSLFAGYVKAGKYLEMGNQMTVRNYTERFRSPIIRKMISAVVPDHIALTSLFFTLGTRTSSAGSWPEGGSFAFARRMRERFEEMGGTIYLNAPVKDIVIENGKATGITLVKNNKRKTADYIIPATDAYLLLHRLLKGKYRDNFFEYRFDRPESYPLLSATLVSIGVDIDMRDKPHELCVNVRKPLKINRSIHHQIIIRHFGFDASFNPQGKSTVQVELDDVEYDYWAKLKKSSDDSYKAGKDRLAKAVITEIEAVYPEIKGHVKMIDVATPLTLNRYCGLYRGAYMSFVSIPGVKQENHRGYIENVENMYLAGQWVFPDGGLPMAAIAGKFAVQRICHKEKINIEL